MKYVILLVVACLVLSLAAVGCDRHRHHGSLPPADAAVQQPA
jgi:hypothetical protein